MTPEAAGAALAPRLPPAAEEEWERLRELLSVIDGPWFGFAFSSDVGAIGVLEERARNLLRGRARRLDLRRPTEPASLAGVVDQLLVSPAPSSTCVWVEALRAGRGTEGRTWEAAWEDVARGANQVRDRLRRACPGGLVFVAPASLKPRFRDLAPDLWSQRMLVLEVEGGASVDSTAPLGPATADAPSPLRPARAVLLPDATDDERRALRAARQNGLSAASPRARRRRSPSSTRTRCWWRAARRRSPTRCSRSSPASPTGSVRSPSARPRRHHSWRPVATRP